MKRQHLLTFLGAVAMAFAGLLLAPLSSRAQIQPADDDKPIRALLVIGGCCHDYAAQKKIITEGVSARANVEWTIAYDPNSTTSHKNPIYDNPDWSNGFDVVVHDECSADVKDPGVIDRILKPHRDGLAGVVIHCGMHCYRGEGFPQSTPWFDFTGLVTTGHGAQLPIAVTYVDTKHPITQGLSNWTTIHEELYNNAAGKLEETAHALARGKQGNDDNVVAWTNTYNGKTRVFATTLGHNDETVADKRYLDLLTRGLLWSVNKLDAKHLKPARQVVAPGPAGAGAMALENLALNQTATASTTQEPNVPGNAVDGDESTRWCASGGDVPQWFQVDLGKPQEITGCRITFEHAAVYWYKIEISPDGKDWKQVIDATSGDSTEQVREHQFKARDVRYVKITINGTGPGSWASINELEVLGTKRVDPHSHAAAPDAEKRLLREVKAPKDFDVTIFAAPPDISYPTCLAATPGGDLFVGIDENGSLDQKPDRGRVIKCVDSARVGKAEQFTVFARMDSPRGLVWDGETLYVLHPPFLTAYHDGGRGVADREETLVSGLAHDLKWRGADHTTNGIRMGIDGWIYIAAGDYGAQHAVGKDGTQLQFRGGGMLRVRPDGSGLEAVSHGERNIYDVAIDPLMNVFTCDNTNDGDGWNVRLAHVFPSANFGYPTLFVHFPEEIVQPLNDYGEGAPTGVLFVSEPGFPAPYGNALYTNEWGRSLIFRHPLEQRGASYKSPTPRETFLKIPRPTGIDVDGCSHLFAASWRGGVFTYAGPNVGFVARLTPKGAAPASFPDLKRLDDAELVELLKSQSHVWRLQTQREILRRGARPAIVRAVEMIAGASEQPLAVRVAALYTLRQLAGQKSNDAIIALSKDNAMREFCLRALSDDRKQSADVVSTLFTSALSDANARTRLMAVVAIGRLGRPELAAPLVPLLVDADPNIAHAVVQALMALHATDVCFKALDSDSPSLAPGAARVLQSFHEGPVVEGLIGRLSSAKDSAVAHAILTALCRLRDREADWDGDWWGTRPDTRGPYFRPVAWEQTRRIDEALRQIVAAGGEEARFLVGELHRHRIDLPEATALMLKQAEADPGYRRQAVELLTSGSDISDDALPLIERFASTAGEEADLRARALWAMERNAGRLVAFEATVRAMLATGREANLPAAVNAARVDVMHDGQNAARTGLYSKLAGSEDSAARELAYSVLLTVSESHQAPKENKAAAANEIEKAWSSPKATASLLRAIAATHFPQYALQVRSRLKDSDADVRSAAALAASQLHLDQTASSNQPMVGSMKYEQVVGAASEEKGDAAQGLQLFQRQGCVACHTTSQSQPPKGPFLGDISSRYSRPEILESILKPSAKIAQGFATNYFKLKDGNVLQGFIVREGGDDVEIRDVTGVSTTISRGQIVKRGTLPKSIMPEGLADNLTIHDLSSILAYLESLKGRK